MHPLTLLLLISLPLHTHATTWKSLAPLPIPIRAYTTVLLNPSQLATIGGGLAGNATTDPLLLYDIPHDSWSVRSSAPLPLIYPNAASINGKIYLLGGVLNEPIQRYSAVADCWVYDLYQDEWTPIEPMPQAEARGRAAVGVDRESGVIYLAGGIQSAREEALDIVSAYDTVRGQWVSLPPRARRMPAPRDHAGGVTVGRKLYVVGGRDGGVLKDTVFVLDLDNLRSGWIEEDGAAVRMPTARAGLAVVVLGEKIYTFGGEGGEGVFNQTEVFDVDKQVWEGLGAMAKPRHGISAVGRRGWNGDGDVIYIPGGNVAEGGHATSYFDAFYP
ncbi:kelch repeat protein [Histoplasma capsulatum var. duboisii H88]|uniref:Kelch repeat protein n=2 Tax=Ajellomyces capsulatus TaxID=5037 RepID=F0UND7_AJEC8|nr:kelch repeat protein [Histoplasma capsulatum H143]EGC47595.1 kelch repeat protein [Histoplasma capsulatum var. duboisii H88]QSS53763.1 kelch repeat protein [Histoplasma capsulatum var. duboisii H88]